MSYRRPLEVDGRGMIRPRLPRWRFILAALAGALTGLIREWLVETRVAPVVVIAVFIALQVVMIALSWPILSYRDVITMTLLAWVAMGFEGMAFEELFRGGYQRHYRGLGVIEWYVFRWLGSLGMASIGVAMSCLAVWMRRSHWPSWAPGRCIVCGYSLVGLPHRVCPECGTENQESDPCDSEIVGVETCE